MEDFWRRKSLCFNHHHECPHWASNPAPQSNKNTEFVRHKVSVYFLPAWGIRQAENEKPWNWGIFSPQVLNPKQARELSFLKMDLVLMIRNLFHVSPIQWPHWHLVVLEGKSHSVLATMFPFQVNYLSRWRETMVVWCNNVIKNFCSPPHCVTHRLK